ncbi:MAG: InlB B-repeat-containing protein [Clostridia bacterium]|nr:InlB B-repeat-containing protein [Clostridia bacterium]
MNKKFKALLTCLALTATMGAMSACDLQSYLPELPFLGGGSSSESMVETESTPEESSSEKEETPEVGKNESMITFVADGETVRVIVYKNGATSITEPAVPEKAGYTGAWEAYELNGNITVNAVYTAIEYTATYMADGEVVATVAYTVENAPVIPEVPAKEYYTGAWEDVEMVGDITINAVYTAIEYTVTFMADGEVVATVPYTVESAEITVPGIPEKVGYGAAWENFALTGGDITVNAIYRLGVYNVTFVADGVTVATEEYTMQDKEITVPAVPAKEHYTGAWEAYELTTGDVVVNAIYTAIEYTVTFVADGEKIATVPYTVENTAIEAPTVPEKEHYENGAWEAYELTGGDITVNATYTAIEYTITFMLGEEVIGTATYTMDNATLGEVEIPAKTGYTGALEDIALDGGDKTVNVVYTANTYTIKYNAGKGEASELEQEVTYDAAYTLATATPKYSWQSFLGWADEKGNMVTSETWNIADDITLTAVYSEGITFDNLEAVPSYMTKGSQTASISIEELNGNKVLKMTASATGTNHALNVTLDFLNEVFADPDVTHLAFDVKSETTQHTNFRRSTIRTTGTVGQWGQEPYEADVQADNTHCMGVRADAFKTFFFSRTDYNNWVNNNKTVEMLISAGNLAAGENLYVDNIRPVTQAQYTAANLSFETGGIRPNGGNLLVYMGAYGSTWQWAVTADSVNNVKPTFSDFGYTNENVTDGNRAMKFTKTAGQITMRFNSTSVQGYKDVMASTGYWAFDLFIPADAGDITVGYVDLGLKNSVIHGNDLIKGQWMTVYGVTGSNLGMRITDTNGGTYMIDNIRPVDKYEYIYGFEANTGGLRTNLVETETGYSGAFYWYNRGADYNGVAASLSVAEGNTERDANAISNVRMATDIVHSGNYSLAFDKGPGYVSFSRHANSAALKEMENGFTFWIYSTVGLNGTTANNFINGVNNKFNGGEGINVPANTWTQITVTAEDIGNGRFLIIQGSPEGTIYLDDFRPLGA